MHVRDTCRVFQLPLLLLFLPKQKIVFLEKKFVVIEPVFHCSESFATCTEIKEQIRMLDGNDKTRNGNPAPVIFPSMRGSMQSYLS